MSGPHRRLECSMHPPTPAPPPLLLTPREKALRGGGCLPCRCRGRRRSARNRGRCRRAACRPSASRGRHAM
eukprot:3631933-Prymnesium_polylepis.1